MQLILETESIVGINTNMSTIEEPLQEKQFLNGNTEEFCKDTCNGNKENIKKQDNIIYTAEEHSCIDNDKAVEEEILPELPEVNVILEKNVNEQPNSMDDADLKTLEDEVKLENEDHKLATTSNELSTSNSEKSFEILQENGISMDDKCIEMSETNESHSYVETNNENDLIKRESELGCENDGLDEMVLIKKEIDDILMNRTSCLKNTISLQTDVEKTNSESDKKTYLDTQTIFVKEQFNEDAVEKTEKNMNNGKLQIDVIPIETEVQNKVEKYINNEDIPLERNADTPLVETSAVKKINDPEPTIVDQLVISSQDMQIDTNAADVNKLEKIVSDTVAFNEENPSENSDIESAVVKEETVFEIMKNNMPQNPEISDVEILNDQDKTSTKESEESTQVETSVVNTESSANAIKSIDESNLSNNAMDCDDVTEVIDKEVADTTSNDEVMVVEDIKEIIEKKSQDKQKTCSEPPIEKEPEKPVVKIAPVICRLSNTLDILSDDDEPDKEEPPEEKPSDKQCINIEDDDDIMVIEEDSSSKDSKTKNEPNIAEPVNLETVFKEKVDETDLEIGENKSSFMESIELSSNKEPTPARTTESPAIHEKKENTPEDTKQKAVYDKPLLSECFLTSSKKKIADMTREDLEEFCVLKIVESIVDRSNLSEIKTKLKTMAHNIDEYRKKAMMLAKQNRDLQVVLKSIQEEQKKVTDTAITPLKITRSVGMQVLMTDKSARRKGPVPVSVQQPVVSNNRQTRNQANPSPRPQKSVTNQAIPVPRLVPANNATIKGPAPQTISMGKIAGSLPNGVRNPPAQKQAEKRPLSKSQSVTVDLTDDEPPAKVTPRTTAPPVRLVSPQNLLAPQRPQFGQSVNSPRKVYIPISGPQSQNIRPGQTFMLKAAPHAGARPRGPSGNVSRMPQNQVRMNRPGSGHRHPAPLPDATKQYQPPNWKALPPAPDLKLSKVENGIVISWKIEGYHEDSYEEIASYQLYAYQETSSPPSTALWKKIGDVKALPLPMACTLTQFMAGFKYYFAVRAVDVRSRLGPFSLPGSILLLNKM